MTTNLLDDALLPTDAPGLRTEIEEVERRQKACLERIRELSAQEDPAKGICHAKEIHEAKQRKMMLQYQKQLRTARLKNLDFSSTE